MPSFLGNQYSWMTGALLWAQIIRDKAGPRCLRAYRAVCKPSSPQSTLIAPLLNDTAWFQCFGCFLLIMTAWGLVMSFGAYQTYYVEILLKGYSSSQVSWIGSVQAFGLFLGGGLCGPLFDRGYLKQMLVTGTVISFTGMMLTSFCTTYAKLMVTQGVVVGIGTGLLLTPSIALLPQWFGNKKALAIGIASTGSNVGGIVYSIVFHGLQPTIGFGWAVRVTAIIMLSTLSLATWILEMRFRPGRPRGLIDWRAFAEFPYLAMTSGCFFGFMGYFIPLWYVQLYAIHNKLANANLDFYLIAIVNAGSIFGRLIPPAFADRTGYLNMIIPCTMMACLVTFLWTAVKTQAGLIAFCFFYGFFASSMIALQPAVYLALTPNLTKLGTRIGAAMMLTSFAVLVGNPIAGKIVASAGGYVGMQIFTGFLILTFALFQIFARIGLCMDPDA